MIATRLLAELREELMAMRQRPPWRVGVVTGVNSSPASVDVSIGGGTATPAVRHLSSYVPTAGDVVVVLERSGDRVVLGRLA